MVFFRPFNNGELSLQRFNRKREEAHPAFPPRPSFTLHLRGVLTQEELLSCLSRGRRGLGISPETRQCLVLVSVRDRAFRLSSRSGSDLLWHASRIAFRDACAPFLSRFLSPALGHLLSDGLDPLSQLFFFSSCRTPIVAASAFRVDKKT